MTVINLRPAGWDGVTPRQWGAMRELIRLVSETAFQRDNFDLFMRASTFLAQTEGRDV